MDRQFTQYFSGNDNPSQEENQYSWMSPAFSTAGSMIGRIWGPIGSQAGKAIGRDVGTDASRMFSGDDVGKVFWDRGFTSATQDPIMGTQLPGGQIMGLMGNFGKSIFGWE